MSFETFWNALKCPWTPSEIYVKLTWAGKAPENSSETPSSTLKRIEKFLKLPETVVKFIWMPVKPTKPPVTPVKMPWNSLKFLWNPGDTHLRAFEAIVYALEPPGAPYSPLSNTSSTFIYPHSFLCLPVKCPSKKFEEMFRLGRKHKHTVCGLTIQGVAYPLES